MAANPRWRTRYFGCTPTIWVLIERACYEKLKKESDVTLNAIWRHIQDGGPDIFNALLQYGYKMKERVMKNSIKKVTLL
jgi:hypothetical protein